MNWQIEFLAEAKRDLEKLDHSVQLQVLKGLQKVSGNPLPVSEGGYGKPLGNKSVIKRSTFLKIKFKSIGIRVVYQLVRTEKIMKIVVISMREDGLVYKIATKRREKYNI